MIEFWAGTEAAYQVVIEAQTKIAAGLAIKAGYFDEMMASLPPLVSVS